MYLYWNTNWIWNHSDTELFKLGPNIEKLPSYFPPHRSIVRILSRHERFTYHLHRFNLAPTSMCPCGNICINFLHYRNECQITAPIIASLSKSINSLVTIDELPKLLAIKKGQSNINYNGTYHWQKHSQLCQTATTIGCHVTSKGIYKIMTHLLQKILYIPYCVKQNKKHIFWHNYFMAFY